MKKISLVIALFVLLIAYPVDAINQPVPGATIIPTTPGPDGILQQIGPPINVNPDGTFEYQLDPGFDPAVIPIFMVGIGPNGGQEMTCVAPDGTGDIGPDTNAIANAFFSVFGQGGQNPANVDPQDLGNFVDGMMQITDQLPNGTPGDFANAIGLQPNHFLDLIDPFNLPPQVPFEIAANLPAAVAPDAFNPLQELPPLVPPPAPGSPFAGLIDDERLPQGLPPDFLGNDFMPIGSLEGDVPFGFPALPANIQTNSNIPLPPGVTVPQGVILAPGTQLPADANIPPGVIFGEGFIPLPGLDVPAGTAFPGGQVPDGVNVVDQIPLPPDYQPSPGFAIVDGQPAIPDNFAFPPGIEPPPGALGLPLPPDAADLGIPLPPGFDPGLIPGLDQGFAFGAGDQLPFGFNPNDFGLQPPPGFDPLTGNVAGDFNPNNFDPNNPPGDPLGGFDPNLDPDTCFPAGGAAVLKAACLPPVGPPIPPGDPNNPNNPLPPGGDPNDPNNPLPPGGDPNDPNNPLPPGGDPNDPNNPIPPGGDPNDPNNPLPPGDPNDPNNPLPPGGDPNDPNNPLPPGDPNDPNNPLPPGPDPNNPIPPAPPPGDPNGGNPPVPPPGDPNGGNPTPPPLPPRSLINAASTSVDANAGEVSRARLVSDAKINKKALAISSDANLFLAKKAKVRGKRVILSFIADPSSSAESATVNVGNGTTVDTVSVNLTNNATATAARFNDSTGQIDVTASISGKRVRGFLLESGSSTDIKRAVRLRGKASKTEDSVVSFKPKADLKDGILYTIVFESGDSVIYGQFVKGELNAVVVRGRIVAPDGQL